MTTPYHAKYFAHELTRQGGTGVDRLSRSLFDASVDLNPHQIEAALFAHFGEARERLELWAEDMVLAVEKELKDTKEQIKALNRQARAVVTVEEQHAYQEKIRDAEKKKRNLRQRIFDTEDEIAEKRDGLISALEKRMAQKTERKTLFTIRWSVV